MELSEYISNTFCGSEDEGILTRNSVAVLVALASEKKMELTPSIWKYACGFILNPNINMAKDLPELPVN